MFLRPREAAALVGLSATHEHFIALHDVGRLLRGDDDRLRDALERNARISTPLPQRSARRSMTRLNTAAAM